MGVKVAFAGHSEDFAGAESSLLALLAHLDPRHHAPIVTLPTHGAFSTRLERLGVPVAYVGSVPWVDQRGAGIVERFGADLEARVEAFAERLRREEVSVVVSNSAVLLEGALAAHRLGLPHAWRIHEMLSRHDNLELALEVSVFPRLLEALAERVLVVSHAVREDLSSVRADVLDVVPNGLPAHEPSPVPRRERVGLDPSVPTCVFVGTLSDAKGVPLLAPLMQRVRRRVPDACCLVVGRDVGAQKPLQRELRRRGLDGAFRFLGFRDDAVHVIACSDALVLPTRVDSLPCVVMEAMTAGVPAVATRSGGASELIVHGETGYLADVDDVDAMADGLARLLSDGAHARALGDAARDKARAEYSMDRMLGAFRGCFDELAARRHEPAPDASRELVARLSQASGRRPDRDATRKLTELLQRLAA